MGFGTLFIGYFLLLNLTYYGFTDIISALVMLMALYKLQTVNKFFRFALIPSGIFAAIGVAELVEATASMFGKNLSVILSYTAASRYLIIGFLTVFILMGIQDVAAEVGVDGLAKRTKIMQPFTYILYAAATVLELPAVGEIFSPKITGAIATVLLLCVFAFMILTLVTIYSAYMHICMPEDVDNDVKEKPSRFGFINQFRERSAEKNREYAEYKIDKARKKNQRKKRKK